MTKVSSQRDVDIMEKIRENLNTHQDSIYDLDGQQYLVKPGVHSPNIFDFMDSEWQAKTLTEFMLE